MTDDELAALLCKVKADYQWADHAYPDEDACGDWEEWLRSDCYTPDELEDEYAK